MLFNTFEFILLFLPITFFIYFFLNKYKLIELSKGWLVLSSLFYYSYWKIDYLPLILLSMIFNYSIGNTLTSNKKLNINKKFVLMFGVTGNILLLGYFKYFDFLIKNINLLLHTNFDLFNILLPLAISFFTFQQIAYLVDSYKGETSEYDFINYALFVTFFPQLIAGPIVHHKEMIPQFSNLRNKILNPKNLSIGLCFFTIGLFKKVIIADSLSPFVSIVYDINGPVSFLSSWIGSLSYALQIYFDFSGYTDMALGIGYMFNIKLPQNFNSPYQATSIQDFWKRWHITLSRFLRDYIYIPLGGNKNGDFNTYKNILVTFIIGGIWHGAAWSFVLWGGAHGIAQIVYRLWRKLQISLPKFISIMFTFLFVNFTWVFFRAGTFDNAIKIIKSMLGITNFSLPAIYHGAIRFGQPLNDIMLSDIKNPIYYILLGILIISLKNSIHFKKEFKPTVRYAVFVSLIMIFTLFNINKVSEFLYFNF